MLQNAFVELTIRDGRITSLIDKQIGYAWLLCQNRSSSDHFLRRELIYEGESGGMVIFEDRPGYWDAWGELHIAIIRQYLSYDS